MRDDLHAAFRSLSASKAFTTVALVVLTLGIGATTAIFSVDAVVLRGLPFDEHDRLVAVGDGRPPNPDFPQDPNRDPLALLSGSPQNYIDWAARQDVFESMPAIAGAIVRAARARQSEAEELRGQRVTASFFDVLRARPQVGPGFTSDNEIDGRDRIVVLSHGLWARRFGSDPDIIGKTLAIEGGPYEVVGVMPPDFAYPVGALRPTKLWVPYVVRPEERIPPPNTISVYLQAVAPLKPGVSVEQAQAHMDQISAALTSEHPVWNKDTRAGARPPCTIAWSARAPRSGCSCSSPPFSVLMIACANVANLLLARASTRQREIGIRSAIGAVFDCSVS